MTRIRNDSCLDQPVNPLGFLQPVILIKSCCQSLTTCRLQFSSALVLDARPPTERHPFSSTSCPIFIGFDRRLIVSAVKERHGKSLVTLHRCATDRFNWIKPVTALSCRVSFLRNDATIGWIRESCWRNSLTALGLRSERFRCASCRKMMLMHNDDRNGFQSLCSNGGRG